MSEQMPSKSVVSVSEMAKMCRVSRSRFYRLVKKNIFLRPEYDETTGRPYYTKEMQLVCLDVRKRNCGVNGKPILFYASRRPTDIQPNRIRKPKAKKKPTNQHADLIDNLTSLGLTATNDQVEAAIKILYPAGIQNLDSGEVTRAVFLYLKRKNTSK